MFQDEAHFGRMVRIRRCWARMPEWPAVSNGYEREFLYVYGAVSPMQGELDWMITNKMNTDNMSEFLAHLSAAHRREFIIMVVDGASSHVAKAPGGAAEHATASLATQRAGTQPTGARLGRTAREGVSQPRVRRSAHRAETTRSRPAQTCRRS
jgi:hypothetical protein